MKGVQKVAYGILCAVVLFSIGLGVWQWREASDAATRLKSAEQQNAKLLYTNGIACSLLSYGEAKNILSTKDALKVEATRVPAGVVSTDSNAFRPAIDTCGYRSERSDNVYLSFSLQQYASVSDAQNQFQSEKNKAVGSKDADAGAINAEEAFTISNATTARRGDIIVSVGVGRLASSKEDDAALAAQLAGKFIAVVAEASLRL